MEEKLSIQKTFAIGAQSGHITQKDNEKVGRMCCVLAGAYCLPDMYYRHGKTGLTLLYWYTVLVYINSRTNGKYIKSNMNQQRVDNGTVSRMCCVLITGRGILYTW